MAQQITPLAPSLPATTAIQDPAARRFAQAVQDALGALRSEAGAVESLNKAAAALAGTAGGTPASIAQWLLTSELYQKLKIEIVAVDVQAKQDLLDESIARQSAIEGIQATLASIEATPEYDPLAAYAVGDMVAYTGKLYRALLETTGNLPTDLTYWEKIGDYASLGELVSAHAIKLDDLEYSMYNPAGEVQAEVAARQTLATQMRGTYAGTDITQVTQGLMHSERVARSSAYDAEVAARQSLATKVLGQADPTGLTLATLTSGLIFEEAQVRSDVDGSLAQTIDALEVTMGENIEAAMLAEQTVRATNDAALVTAINTAWAFTGATQAVSQSGQNLITNWTAAQANRWSQLEAEVFTAGGKTIRAALAEESDARATLEGQVSSSWMIKAQIDVGTGQPYVAGIALGAEGQGGLATSKFVVRADGFAMVMPGYGEYVPFAIGDFGPAMFGDGGFSVPVSRLVNQAAQPTSFLETFESGSVAQWTNHFGAGELSIVSVPDSLTGGKVLRIGNNSGNDQAWLIHKQNIPFDPSALYRIKFRVRRTAGTGVVYLGLAGVAADGVTWVNTSGSNSWGSQHYVAASNVGPSSTWTEYVGYVKGTAATGQNGTNPPITAPLKLHQSVKYIRPLILVNHDSVAGITEVDYCSIELMTDTMNWDGVSGTGKDALVTTASTALTNANAAQAAANNANNTLADIASDNKLTPVEKQSAANEWGIINRERASIQAQASALGISSELDDYNYTYAVLNDYITPLLTDLQSPSAIDGPTFRDKWSYFYEYRQRLMNKMSAVAATKADWASVQGSGKPENGATVGADSSNLRAGVGVNMVFNGDYTDGLAGTVVGWRSEGNQHSLGWNATNYTVQGEGTAWIYQPGTNGTAVFDANIWNGKDGQYFAVTPGQRYEFYAYLNAHRCIGTFGPLFLDAAGNQLWHATGTGVSHESTISSISDMRISHGFVVAPANAVKALLIIRGVGINSNDPYVFFSRVYFGEAGAGQTEPSPWSPGRGISQITPSNVTTYIANAAIGNAQIGGDIYSDLWNTSGNTQGWYLQRNGNLYCANAYVRGNVEASSLKANTALVNTLHINDNAVTVPVTYTSSATMALAYNTWTTIGGAYINPEGAVVFVHAFAQFSNPDGNSAPVFLRVVSPSGAVIAAAGPTVTSTMNWNIGSATHSGSVALSGAFSETGNYTLQMRAGIHANHSTHHRALLLLAGKR